MDFQSEGNIDLSPTIKRTMHDGIEGQSTQKKTLDTNVNIEIQDADIHDATMGVDHLNPVVGMTFKSFQEACDFYNQYAKIVGFGTKVKRSWFTDDGQRRGFTLACCKEGKAHHTTTDNYWARPSARTGCLASVRAKLKNDGLFYVTKAELEHNHEVTPSKLRFFHSHKELPEKVKRQLEYNDSAGIPPCKTFQACVVEDGGYENVSYGEEECRNHLEKYRRLALGEGDAQALYRYFSHMQAQSPNFFYAMDVDEEGRLRNVFWADSRSRAAYEYFGDVISFGTTYLTNRYSMPFAPFAPFVGVNHHNQSILLGCALLSRENTKTFIWLFQTWLSCMSGIPPKAIITDQCKAMKGAIAEVFPEAHHRLCLWHIMQKLPVKLSGYKEYKEIKRSLKNKVYDSLRVEQFEKDWEKMIEQYGLEDNEWLCALYEDRHHWALVLVKDIFWANMSTTQRSESMNAFFDGYVHPKTSLKQFISKYDVALQSKFEKEAKADFESFHKFPKLISEHPVEEQLSKIYTIGIFKKFQEELKALVSCTFSFVHIDGDISKFQIKERIKQKDGTMTNKIFEVHYKGGEVDVWCICRLFQFRGIMCRHALTVLNYEDVNEIPSRYILNRWRKDFKHLYSLVRSTSNVMPTGPAQRYNSIQKSCTIFVEIVALSEEKFHHVMKSLNEARNQAMDDSTLSQSTKTKEIEIGDPVHVKSKGRPVEKRKISTVDQKVKKKKVSKQTRLEMKNLDALVEQLSSNVKLNEDNQQICNSNWGSFYQPIFSSHHEIPRPYTTVLQEHVYPTQYIFHVNSQEQAILPNSYASLQATNEDPKL